MTLDQRLRMFSRQRLTMLDDKLVIRVDSIGRSTENSLLYTEIAPAPGRIRQVAWAWFAVAALALGGAAICLWLGFNATRRDADGYFFMTIVCSIPFALSLYGAIRRTINVIVFPTTRGNLIIRNEKPSPESCREFVQALQQRATESRDIEKRVIRNLLKALRHEDFLDDWKYQKARERFGISDDT